MTKALTEKSDKNLAQELRDMRESLRVFRFGASGGKAKNPHEGQTLRKEIARILTELSRSPERVRSQSGAHKHNNYENEIVQKKTSDCRHCRIR